MKSFDKLTGIPVKDAELIGEAILRNTNEDRSRATHVLLDHHYHLMQPKSKLGGYSLTAQDMSDMQATYLKDRNPKNEKPGYRTKGSIGKTTPENIPLLMTTIMPVSVHFNGHDKGFRLDFGQMGNRSNSAPVVRLNYDFGQAKYALQEWYKACIAIFPLSCCNEYIFSTCASILYASIKRMQQA